MSYKTTPVNQFPKLVSQWIKKYDVTAPAQVKNGLEYKTISDPAEMVLNNRVNTTYAPKHFSCRSPKSCSRLSMGASRPPN